MKIVIETGRHSKNRLKYRTHDELMNAIENLNSELSEITILMQKLLSNYEKK